MAEEDRSCDLFDDNHPASSNDVSLRIIDATYSLSEYTDGSVRIRINCGNCLIEAAEMFLNSNPHVHTINSHGENPKADSGDSGKPENICRVEKPSKAEPLDQKEDIKIEDVVSENTKKLETGVSTEKNNVSSKELELSEVEDDLEIEIPLKSLSLDPFNKSQGKSESAKDWGQNKDETAQNEVEEKAGSSGSTNKTSGEPPKEMLPKKTVYSSESEWSDDDFWDYGETVETKNIWNKHHAETSKHSGMKEVGYAVELSFTDEDWNAMEEMKYYRLLGVPYPNNPELYVPIYHKIAKIYQRSCRDKIHRELAKF